MWCKTWKTDPLSSISTGFTAMKSLLLRLSKE